MSDTIKLLESISKNLDKRANIKQQTIDLMNKLNITYVGTADEHKIVRGNTEHYGYASIEHKTLGSFYVSFEIRGRKCVIEPSGFPWEFLTDEEPNSQEVVNFLENNINDLNIIITNVDRFFNSIDVEEEE